jgi:hypothetical protein
MSTFGMMANLQKKKGLNNFKTVNERKWWYGMVAAYTDALRRGGPQRQYTNHKR